MEHRVNPSSFPPGMPVPRKARHGCVVQVLGALVFGAVVLLGVMAIVAPWGFYMGGHFHIIPQWTGWGQMHSKLAGDYAVLVTFSPKTGKGLGLTHVSGNAVICTPRGEKFNLRLAGDFQNPHGTDLQGKTAHLYASYYSTFSGSTAPSLDFAASGTTLTLSSTMAARSIALSIPVARWPRIAIIVLTFKRWCRSRCMKAATQTSRPPAPRSKASNRDRRPCGAEKTFAGAALKAR